LTSLEKNHGDAPVCNKTLLTECIETAKLMIKELRREPDLLLSGFGDAAVNVMQEAG
jgi:hypothetical protein